MCEQIRYSFAFSRIESIACSVFQSRPDVWAIDQVFPIVPLHRLDERPDRRAVITDITCGSDGRIDHYVDNEGVEASLPLHDWRPDEPCLLGIFLVGACQEIMGDCHNLFGDTHSANVELLADSDLSADEKQRYLAELEAGLEDYTYLED